MAELKEANGRATRAEKGRLSAVTLRIYLAHYLRVLQYAKRIVVLAPPVTTRAGLFRFAPEPARTILFDKPNLYHGA
jgi:hypothetical protein